MSWTSKVGLTSTSKLSVQLRKFVLKYPEYVEQIKDEIVKKESKSIKKASTEVTSIPNNAPHSNNTEENNKTDTKSYISTGISYLQSLALRSESPKREATNPSPDFQTALKTVNSFIPQVLKQSQPIKDESKHIPHWMKHKSYMVTKASIDQRTTHLVRCIGTHLTEAGRLRRLESLTKHLITYPQAKGVAVKNNGIPRILSILKTSTDKHIQSEGRQCLSLLGYVPPVSGHGLRLLSIDGGGIRGLVALELLRELENKTGEKIHKLFDYIGGVSSGAILALLLGAHKLSVQECEDLYRKLGNKVFTQTTIKGATSLMMSNAYYNSENWSNILKDTIGEEHFHATNKCSETPKLCVVSTQATHEGIKAFLFRNYELPYRVSSHYNGSSRFHLWEAARASAAAPGYFSEFKTDDKILMDGGVLVNNPTAILLHEAKKLWPNTRLQSVISIGTGRHEPVNSKEVSSLNLSKLLKALLYSATDTEGVHTMLHDLMPDKVYFRFNPYLSEEFGLDEIRDDRIDLMMEDTNLYIRKNDHKFNEAINNLVVPKSKLDEFQDWVNLQNQLWVNY